MNSNTKSLITQVVEKHACLSSEYGVPLNQEMKQRRFNELKLQLESGLITVGDLNVELKND
jgi:hypothetical protein